MRKTPMLSTALCWKRCLTLTLPFDLAHSLLAELSPVSTLSTHRRLLSNDGVVPYLQDQASPPSTQEYHNQPPPERVGLFKAPSYILPDVTSHFWAFCQVCPLDKLQTLPKLGSSVLKIPDGRLGSNSKL